MPSKDKKVELRDLMQYLEAYLGSRCLDDEEDREVVAKLLLEDFKMEWR